MSRVGSVLPRLVELGLRVGSVLYQPAELVSRVGSALYQSMELASQVGSALYRPVELALLGQSAHSLLRTPLRPRRALGRFEASASPSPNPPISPLHRGSRRSEQATQYSMVPRTTGGF